MKVSFFFLFILGITSCSALDEKLKSPEDFSKNIVECISRSDFNCYSHFMLSKEDLRELVLTSTSSSEDEKNSMLSNLDEKFNRLLEMNRVEFEKMDFEGFSYESCTYTIRKNIDSVQTINNLKITVKKNEMVKTLVFNNLVETERGWVFTYMDKQLSKTNNSLYDRACEICLIKERMSNANQEKAVIFPMNKPNKKRDSLDAALKELSTLYDDKVEQFKQDENYRSINVVKDSVKAICTRSIVFGSHLSKERRIEIMNILANEILQMNSGFTLKFDKIIPKIKPQIEENGDVYVKDRITGSRMHIDDLDAWKENELKEFYEWRNQIDNLLIELHKKPYDDFSELEKIVFNYQLHKVLN